MLEFHCPCCGAPLYPTDKVYVSFFGGIAGCNECCKDDDTAMSMKEWLSQSKFDYYDHKIDKLKE